MESKIFITSNTFFGREKLLSSRNYTNIDLMNRKMVDEWNSIINHNDVIYHLGYFSHDPISTSEVLEQLNGTIYFLNNPFETLVYDVMHIFKNIVVLDGEIVEIPDKNVIISYYPLEAWDLPETYQIYGFDKLKNDLNLRPNKICASYDIWNKPVLLDDLIDFMKTFNEITIADNFKYELLKDLPELYAGEVFYKKGDIYISSITKSKVLSHLPKSLVENTPEWFKKIEK